MALKVIKDARTEWVKTVLVCRPISIPAALQYPCNRDKLTGYVGKVTPNP